MKMKLSAPSSSSSTTATITTSSVKRGVNRRRSQSSSRKTTACNSITGTTHARSSNTIHSLCTSQNCSSSSASPGQVHSSSSIGRVRSIHHHHHHHHRSKLHVSASATSTDDQARELAAAQRRWEGQVRQGRFRSIGPEEVRGLMKEGWILLDVRPEEECAIASVDGAINVPLFTVDTSLSPGSLVKQMSAFGMGGWWLGTKHMVPNKSFMADVMKVIPQDGKAIIACQKGLRSLAACEQLANAGLEHIAWLNGGYDMTKKGDLPVKGDVDIRYAGIGGVSSLLGWTEVQQEENKGLGGGVSNVLKVIAVLVALDTIVLLIEALQAKYSG